MMKTKPDCSIPRTGGMSRTGVMVSLAVLVAVSVAALLGFRLRALKSRALPAANVTAEEGAVTYANPAHHLRLAAPAGWTIDASEPNGRSAMTLITLQPPEGTSMNTLAIWKHPPTPGFSSRTWAEQEVAAGARIGKQDGTIRPDSWSELVVAGHPAASLITDLTAGSGGFTVYHVYALADTTSMKFRFMVPAEEFNRVKPALDAILASCKLD